LHPGQYRWKECLDQFGTISPHHQFWCTASAAAIEALWNTNSRAALDLFEISDEDAEMNRYVLFHAVLAYAARARISRRSLSSAWGRANGTRRLACGGLSTKSKVF
jgi:hypothetical protein